VLAGAAADPGKPVLHDPAGEELLNDLAHDGPPETPTPRKPLVVDGGELPEVILDEAIEG
jgi:hypothetical protein